MKIRVKIFFAILLCLLQFSYNIEASVSNQTSDSREAAEFVVLSPNLISHTITFYERTADSIEDYTGKCSYVNLLSLKSKSELKHSFYIQNSKELSYNSIEIIYLITKFSTST